jgi:inner membrane protein
VASIPSHIVAAAAIGMWFYRPGVPRRFWVLGAVAAALPDADVIGFSAGIRYGATLGAAAVAVLVVAFWFPRGLPGVRAGPLAAYLALATGSHGLLDAFTDGGLGIALLWPVDGNRYFFPFRPIEVSPIGLRRFLSERGLAVLASELKWVWLPSAALALVALGVRRPRAPSR